MAKKYGLVYYRGRGWYLDHDDSPAGWRDVETGEYASDSYSIKLDDLLSLKYAAKAGRKPTGRPTPAAMVIRDLAARTPPGEEPAPATKDLIGRRHQVGRAAVNKYLREERDEFEYYRDNPSR